MTLSEGAKTCQELGRVREQDTPAGTQTVEGLAGERAARRGVARPNGHEVDGRARRGHEHAAGYGGAGVPAAAMAAEPGLAAFERYAAKVGEGEAHRGGLLGLRHEGGDGLGAVAPGRPALRVGDGDGDGDGVGDAADRPYARGPGRAGVQELGDDLTLQPFPLAQQRLLRSHAPLPVVASPVPPGGGASLSVAIPAGQGL